MKKRFAELVEKARSGDSSARVTLGSAGGVFGIAINFTIFVIELVVGVLSSSVAITADAFHNLTDVVSSIITIISFRLANKPADKKHPFGHGRVEYLSALLVAAIIIIIGYEFIRSSFGKILHPSPVYFSVISLVLVLAAIPAKILLSLVNHRLGSLIDSSTLKATSFDAMSDVLILTVASVSLIVAAFSKVHIDGIIGVIVAAFIIYSGISLAKQELNPLLGEAPDPELVKKIYKGVLDAKYVSGVHDLIIHNYGPGKFMASIHAEVPCDVSSLIIHESIDEVEHKLSEELGILLVVHMDPLNKDDKIVKEAAAVVKKAVRNISEVRSMHDFRVVGGGERKNLIFDIVVESDSVITKQDEEKLKDKVADEVHKIDRQYNCVINIDRNYVMLN